MNGADIPVWSAWIVVLLALAGAGFSLIGAVGLIRFRTFYERAHAPTLGATLGTTLVLCSSLLLLSLIEGRLVLRDGLIGVFLTVTTAGDARDPRPRRRPSGSAGQGSRCAAFPVRKPWP